LFFAHNKIESKIENITNIPPKGTSLIEKEMQEILTKRIEGQKYRSRKKYKK